MKIWPQENMDSEIEAPLMRSAIGGYAEKDLYEAEQLAEAIREDQTEFLPRRLAEEIRRTEAARQLAKMREAEKRKQEAAAMNMPPPDSFAGSVVAGRNRSKPLKSSSRMDPGEGCSRWADTPPRKRLAAKATMGETEKIFQRNLWLAVARTRNMIQSLSELVRERYWRVIHSRGQEGVTAATAEAYSGPEESCPVGTRGHWSNKQALRGGPVVQ